MNAAGDYSAAYAILKTDSEFQGHGMVSSSVLFHTPFFYFSVFFLFNTDNWIAISCAVCGWLAVSFQSLSLMLNALSA